MSVFVFTGIRLDVVAGVSSFVSMSVGVMRRRMLTRDAAVCVLLDPAFSAVADVHMGVPESMPSCASTSVISLFSVSAILAAAHCRH